MQGPAPRSSQRTTRGPQETPRTRHWAGGGAPGGTPEAPWAFGPKLRSASKPQAPRTVPQGGQRGRSCYPHRPHSRRSWGSGFPLSVLGKNSCCSGASGNAPWRTRCSKERWTRDRVAAEALIWGWLCAPLSGGRPIPGWESVFSHPLPLPPSCPPPSPVSFPSASSSLSPLASLQVDNVTVKCVWP